jgi:hypothetical protein
VNNVCAFPCPSSIHSSDSLLHVPHINNCYYLLLGITKFFCISVAVSVMLSCKKNLFKEVHTSYHRNQAREHWQANWVGVGGAWLCMGALKRGIIGCVLQDLDINWQPPVDQVGIFILEDEGTVFHRNVRN